MSTQNSVEVLYDRGIRSPRQVTHLLALGFNSPGIDLR